MEDFRSRAVLGSGSVLNAESKGVAVWTRFSVVYTTTEMKYQNSIFFFPHQHLQKLNSNMSAAIPLQANQYTVLPCS